MNARIARDTLARPECEPQSGLEIKEGHGSELELFADHPFGVETETVPVEPNRTIQVIDADC